MNRRVKMKREKQFQAVVMAVIAAFVQENGPLGDEGAGVILRRAKKAGVPEKMLYASLRKLLRGGLDISLDREGVEMWLGDGLTFFKGTPFPLEFWEDSRMTLTPKTSVPFTRKIWNELYRKLRLMGKQLGGLNNMMRSFPDDPCPLPS